MVNRYPSTLIDELNRLLAPHGQMIDGSVTDDVTDGIAADVSPFHVTRSGPRMHGAFGMLLHVGPRIRAEIETSHNGGKDFSIALSGDPKSDARLILSKTRDLLQLRKGATANPAGRPLLSIRSNPISDLSAVKEITSVVRGVPPGCVALYVSHDWGGAGWVDDTLPDGMSVTDINPRYQRLRLAWNLHPDVTYSMEVELHAAFASHDEGWREVQTALKIGLYGLKLAMSAYDAPPIDPSQFVKLVLDANPSARHVQNGSEHYFKLAVPRTPAMTQKEWAQRVQSSPNSGEPNPAEAAALVAGMNRLLESVYTISRGLVARAAAAKGGETVESRYSVVLTYKGVVLEVVPVETQQEAIDAMTAMQGELRIKTVKGGSSKGAKANPYGRRARR